MANDVRRDLGRIGRDVGRFGRDVGRFGRCVGRSSGCRFLVWLPFWSLAGSVAQSLWAVLNQLICMLLTGFLRQLKWAYQKAMLSGESYLQLFIANIVLIFRY